VGLADGRALPTQRITVEGEKADVYLSQVKAAFTANPLAAMNKLAIAMAKADPRSYGPRRKRGKSLLEKQQKLVGPKQRKSIEAIYVLSETIAECT
jgi:hypothetical protein